MYWLPPESLRVVTIEVDSEKTEIDVDIDLLCKELKKKRFIEAKNLNRDTLKYPELAEALEQKIQGKTVWSVGTIEERLAHLKKKVGIIYHPDNYSTDEDDPIVCKIFAELFKSIWAEIKTLENGIALSDEPTIHQGFGTSSKFQSRFRRKNTSQTTRLVHPINIVVTLEQLYKQEEVPIPETNSVLKCNGDLSDNCHRIIEERQVIVHIKDEPNAEKRGLDYVVKVLTNPLQLLYFTHKVTLPNGQEVAIKTGGPLVQAGLGFAGKEGIGNLIVEYKIARMPPLSRDIRGKLHEINLEVFYKKD